jgi:cell division septum initiation protein DivIVA
MKYKMTFAVGAATGYVLGTRAGRERYEQMKRMVKQCLESPQAQRAKEQARAQAGELAGRARATAGSLAGQAKGKAGELAGKAKGQADHLREAAKSKADSMPGMHRRSEPARTPQHQADAFPQRSTLG